MGGYSTYNYTKTAQLVYGLALMWHSHWDTYVTSLSVVKYVLAVIKAAITPKTHTTK